MDPKKLLYMKSVVDHGSFSKAAKELQVSQPALSTSMKRLEASLGFKLLERGPMGVVPTTAGEMLYSRAWFIKDEMDIARHQIEGGEHEEKQNLTVGAIVSLVANVIPLAVCKWRESYPDTHLRIVENSHPDLIMGLLRTDLDFIIAFTGCSEIADGLKQRVLFRDRLVIFTRAKHPMTKITPSWQDLSSYPWVSLLVGRQGPPMIEQIIASEGVRGPKQLTECMSVSFMKTVVEHSDHIGMLPNHVIEDEIAAGRLEPLEITSLSLNRNIAVFFRERTLLDEASRAFLDHVSETGARLSRNIDFSKH
jgi:DNA-binding transcriptional LysR family regulator